jgi:hypothetical protein
MSTSMCRSCAKKLHKVTEEIVLNNLYFIIEKSAKMNFIA